MKVFTYIRVSSEEQAKDGDSLAMQTHKLQAWAELFDAEIVAAFADEGISGYNGKRPGFEEMIARSLDRECEAVVVYSIKRFARNTLVTLETILALEKRGVRFISLTESIDTSTPIGKFMVTVFAGLAQLERDETAQRTKDVLADKKRRGEAVGTAPYGFYREITGYSSNGAPEYSKDLSEHPMEQRVIETIRGYDGMSFKYIADELNAAGFTNRKQNVWTARAVHKIHSKYIKK